MKNKIKNRKGFTLIELIMVIIIIGVLAAMALSQYTSFVEKGRTAEAIRTLGAFKTDVLAYRMEKGEWPPNDNTYTPNVSIGTRIEAWQCDYPNMWACGFQTANWEYGAYAIMEDDSYLLYAWRRGTGPYANKYFYMAVHVNGTVNWVQSDYPFAPK